MPLLKTLKLIPLTLYSISMGVIIYSVFRMLLMRGIPLEVFREIPLAQGFEMTTTGISQDFHEVYIWRKSVAGNFLGIPFQAAVIKLHCC